MIFINRPAEIPAKLQDAIVERTKEKITDLILAGEKVDWSSLDHWKKVREQLWNMQHQKCAYCERSREMKYETDVEHFRPKSGVREDTSHPGYWWLAFEWSNLLASCKTCNSSHKGTLFPIDSDGIRARLKDDSLSAERALLVNPSDENPEDFLAYHRLPTDIANNSSAPLVQIVGIDVQGRGDTTIRVLGLRNGELPVERGRVYEDVLVATRNLEAALQAGRERPKELALGHIRRLVSAERPFSGTARFYVRELGYEEFLVGLV